MTTATSGIQELADWLPPRELWPERVYRLPEFAADPDPLNSTEELLDRQVAGGRGDHPAILCDDDVITYEELRRRANRLGNALRRLGVGEGDRVMLLSLNEPPALVANFAALKLGAVVVPTTPLLPPDRLAHIAADCAAEVLVVSSVLVPTVLAALPGCPALRHVVVFGEEGTPAPAGPAFHRLEELVDGEPTELDPVRRSRTAVSVLLYSSGLTRPARATAHFVEEALIIPDTFGRYGWRVRPDDVIGPAGPMSFAGGYSSIATIPYRFGATVATVPLGKSTPADIFALIKRHRITLMTGMSTGYSHMLAVADADPEDLRTLRMATCGGEPLPPATLRGWRERFGHEICEGFGTNGMMYVFISNAVAPRVKPGTAGVAMPGYAVRALTETGQDARPGELGQLYARGPVGTVHWGPPAQAGAVRAEQQATVRDGWVKIGDYVTIDAEGYVTYVAREEDLIWKAGQRFGPGVVESALLEHPAVAEAGVLGASDPAAGQRVLAYVVLAAGNRPSADLAGEIVGSCRDRLDAAQLPDEVEFVDSLPRTPYGTLLRRILWPEWIAARRAEPAMPAGG